LKTVITLLVDVAMPSSSTAMIMSPFWDESTMAPVNVTLKPALTNKIITGKEHSHATERRATVNGTRRQLGDVSKSSMKDGVNSTVAGERRSVSRDKEIAQNG
jgi:hypothetical protein